MTAGSTASIYLFVGTYTEPENSQSEGIYIYRMDTSGNLTPQSIAKGVANPSFLAIHPSHNYLYAVNELKEFKGQSGGGVSAFAIDPASGYLTLLNTQPSQGEEPCYISIDGTGRYALVANYTSGNIALFPIEVGGKLGPVIQAIQEFGSSINPERQEGPHAHCFLPDPGNTFALEANLGIDKLLVYQMDIDQGRLDKHAEVLVHPGAGPRHLAFNPKGQYLFLINELNNTLTSYRYQSGSLQELHTVSTLPAGFNGKNSCADIHITPDGKFLYGSNRGHDSIVCFQVDEKTGALSYQAHTPTGGQEPRNFVIDPRGEFLLVANQKSNNIVTFKIDPDTGSLIKTGVETNVPTPVCLKFAVLNS